MCTSIRVGVASSGLIHYTTNHWPRQKITFWIFSECFPLEKPRAPLIFKTQRCWCSVQTYSVHGKICSKEHKKLRKVFKWFGKLQNWRKKNSIIIFVLFQSCIWFIALIFCHFRTTRFHFTIKPSTGQSSGIGNHHQVVQIDSLSVAFICLTSLSSVIIKHS